MDYIDKLLRERLKPSRYQHTLGVAKSATYLGEKYGVDPQKCKKAALFHDICKSCTTEELDQMIHKYGLPERYLGKPKLSHSKVGAEYIVHELGESDEEIIDAVRFHTTGRANMTDLEMIIYLADMIEENREYNGVAKLRNLSEVDLQLACLISLKDSIEFLQYKGESIDEDTILAMEWLMNKVKLKNGGTVMTSKDYALLTCKTLDSRKGEDILALNIESKSSIADYFILASASNERLVGALVDFVEDELAKNDLLPKSIEGKKESGWILMDYGDIIVNVLTYEMREKYNIEKVWADCDKLEWED